MLSMLNTFVHHEMLSPIKSTVTLAETLKESLKGRAFIKEKEMAQTIYTSSKLLQLHANDLLDHKIIERGVFQPIKSRASLSKTVHCHYHHNNHPNCHYHH